MTRHKRIMMISTHGYVAAEPELGKPDTGGQVVYVLELSKSLARLGYEVDILTRQFEAQPHEEMVNGRVRVLRFPCGGDEFIRKEVLVEDLPEWIENVTSYLESQGNGYTLINTHYWDAGVAGQALANRFAIPHLHTPHSIGAWKRDNMGESAHGPAYYNFARRIRDEKIVYDECDAIIATTPVQRQMLRNQAYDVNPDKIVVIPPGYDDMRFFPVSRAERAALKREHGHAERRIILALGRMAHNKGYDLLLRAMPFVCERHPDVRLLLAPGSRHPTSEEVAQIETLKALAAELKIQDCIVFLDYISDEALPDFYRLADVFALPSRYEPFGMTAVEAMACGTPTVITTEGGLWEMVRWGVEALYANPFDPAVFGFAIHALLDVPRLADEISKYAPQKARTQFTWINIAQQLLRITPRQQGGQLELSA